MPVIPSDGLSNQGFTHQEMIDEVSDQLRNVNISAKITRWLNIEIFKLSTRRNWEFLFENATVTTDIGSLESRLNNRLAQLLFMYIPAIPRTLYPIDERRLGRVIPSWATLNGTVTHYMLKGSLVRWFRIPDAQYEVNYDYYRYPTKLTNPNDISDFPVEWHPVIITGAIIRGFRYENNEEQLKSAIDDYNELYRYAWKATMKRPDKIHVLGSSEGTYRSPRVALPDHFPRV